MADGSPWHEDDDFWETFRDYLFPPEKIDAASDEVDHLLELIPIESGAPILDIPCGVGRHAVELAARGYRVTGVDATQAYLTEARDRARNTDGQVDFLRRDMREFRQDETFDVILNLYTSFGYFAERTEDTLALQNFYRSLKQGGTLVMSLTSKEILAGEFQARTWTEMDDVYILEEHEITDNWNWIENRWIICRDDGLREFDVSHRLYSAHELVEMVAAAGFSDATVYGDLEGSEYDQDAERLLVVAQK